MLTYFLDNQPGPGPRQLDGLVLRKERNRIYRGFLYRRLGYVAGAANLRFTDPDSVFVLRASRKQYGLRAETPFRIESDGTVLYDGFVDYATFSDDGSAVSVGLRDDLAVGELSAQATTPFRLTAGGSLRLHTRRLGGAPGLVADPNTLVIARSETVAVPITHSVPLTRRLETDQTVAGTLTPVVSPLASDRCYYNSTAQPQSVRLSGLISGTPVAASAVTATLRAVPIGNEAGAVVIGAWPVSAVPTPRSIAVNAHLEVAPGQSLKLEWVGSGPVTAFSFTYDATMRIVLSDEPVIPASTGYGLSAHDAFAQLVGLASGGKLSLVSGFLRTDPDGQLFLASGEGVRGLPTSLSVSLQQLFLTLSNLFNLRLWVEGATVRLEKRATAPVRRTRLETITSRVETMALEYVYNSVKVGSQTWQAEDAALSGDEFGGLRTYSTGITSQRGELDLSTDIITAGTLIEQQRRRQFDPQTASASKAGTLDASLFLIASFGAKAETLERCGPVTGVYDPATAYNLRLSPGRALDRHSGDLAASLPLSAQLVNGSDTLAGVYNGRLVSEANPLPGSTAPQPGLVTITAPLSMADYAAIGDELDYRHGNTIRTGEVLAAEWRLSNAGPLLTVTLFEP